jgi:hypothetical protein
MSLKTGISFQYWNNWNIGRLSEKHETKGVDTDVEKLERFYTARNVKCLAGM